MYTLRQATAGCANTAHSVSNLRKKHGLAGFKPNRIISCPPPSQGGVLYTHTQQTQHSPPAGVTLKLAKAPTSPGGHIQLGGSVGVTARAVCPQTSILGSVFASAYAADVPTEVLEHYQMVGLDGSKDLLKHGRKFTLSTQTRDH